MKEGVVQLAPLLFWWMAAAMVLLRCFASRRMAAIAGGGAGFCAGVVSSLVLSGALRGDAPIAVVKAAVAIAFALLFAWSAAAVYRTAGVTFAMAWVRRLAGGRCASAVGAFLGGMLCGSLIACRLPEPGWLSALALGTAGVVFLFLALLLERHLPAWLTVTADSLALFTVATILLISSSSLRFDLFAPLSMKVMKFTHDFVHQFFESMLIPDHLFIRTEVWHYIGFLFSNDVGFWGGLIIWFTPPFLVIWALWRERLPQVSHIRQGARRRKLLAGYIRERRCRLILPWFSVIFLSLAVYKSLSPAVEYWDPKPIPVTAGSAGELFIPMKTAEYDLQDGRLHKFIFKQEGESVRFFALRKPNGRLVVLLDACSICRPEGYGQAEGSVVCYYCKTLIPLETVGEPGGCNPVPLSFSQAPDGVRIPAGILVNRWLETVQPAKKVPGREK